MQEPSYAKSEREEKDMNEKEQMETQKLVRLAAEGDKGALEQLLTGVQDLVFNLSLRMLGTIHDAEDASQEILIRVMTNLASFRGESAFTTWVFRIAVNHLKNYRKSMFAQHPLSFEYYGEDIVSGKEKDIPDLTMGVDRNLLEQELKLSYERDASVPGYGQPLYLHSRNHVSCGQPSGSRDTGDFSGGLQAETVQN